MKPVWFFALAVLTILLWGVGAPALGPEIADLPQYDGDKLLRPDQYRDWVFLSSGLGMSYSDSNPEYPMFTNVFVPRWAYDEFRKQGKWPDKTMFVVEERASESKGSINQHGHFQSGLIGLGVEVKDSRLAEKWAYFNFADNQAAAANPKPACWQCHEDHAAVEHTFVQFYPTLKPVAEKFGTYSEKKH
jgi:hypothetical protein